MPHCLPVGWCSGDRAPLPNAPVMSMAEVGVVSNLQPALSTTPRLHAVFRAFQRRRCFTPGKRKPGNLRPVPSLDSLTCQIEAAVERHLATCVCSAQPGCLSILSQNPEFLKALAAWRQAWVLTPRKQKQTALLHALRETPRKRRKTATLEEQPVCSQPSVPSVQSVQHQEMGTCSLDGRRHLVLTGKPTQRANRCYPLLGHSLCQPAFKCLSGISGSMLWRAATYADQGLVTWKMVITERLRNAMRCVMLSGWWSSTCTSTARSQRQRSTSRVAQCGICHSIRRCWVLRVHVSEVPGCKAMLNRFPTFSIFKGGMGWRGVWL